MELSVVIIALAAGLCVGMAAAFILRLGRAKTARELADELIRESEARRQEELGAVLESVRASFGDLSLKALSRSSEELVKLAQATLATEREAGVKELGEKKSLIDQQLKEMTVRLENVSSLVKELEKDREHKFGELSQHLKSAHEQTAALTQTTNSLREALASTKARGQWGERMAEDVLRMAGFVENVNYVKQKATAEGSIPDFTFLLPKELKLNMDVKFPLDNYMKYLEADSESDREQCRKAFLRDVKSRIKEVTGRDYINPEENTVDYVLLFIPNEQIYAFIHEQDSSILDNALADKVVFCSPVTLFAILAVIRQSVDNFALERTSDEIMSLLAAFNKQWGEFTNRLEKLGNRLEGALKDYEALNTTRRRQLEKPLKKIEDLRNQRGLPVAALNDGKEPPEADFDEPAAAETPEAGLAAAGSLEAEAQAAGSPDSTEETIDVGEEVTT